MFDFLFKKRDSQIVVNVQQSESEPKLAGAGSSDKAAELVIAQSFSGQEQAALAFILQSNFADARLQAFQHIHSAVALASVTHEMRNTDRRVSRLAQEKLARLRHQQKMQDDVQACLAHGQQLMQKPYVVANQLAAWDKERLSLGEYGDSLGQIKLELENRLSEQTDLQRQVLQVTSALRALAGSVAPIEESDEVFAACVARYQSVQSHYLVGSLPKNQLSQMSAEIEIARAALKQSADAKRVIDHRSLLLLGWESEGSLDLNNVKAEWKKSIFSGVIFSAEQQQQIATQDDEINVIVSRQTASKLVRDESDPKILIEKENRPRVNVDPGALLDELERALEAGALQQALDINKSLRWSDEHFDKESGQRLQGLRLELNRLLDWAKWGGSISREELIKVADALIHADIAPIDIAKQVGGLRARWKELDRTSGASPQSVWERFDSACTGAYGIAEVYFTQQGKLRSENLVAAQNQLERIEKTIATLPELGVDWKVHQAYINKIKLEWRTVGVLDRKSRATLEAQFTQKISKLNEPLIAAREAAVLTRQQLIRAVAALDVADRNAVDQIKQFQQQWQQEASMLLLARKDEQDLWHQFRTACDAFFLQRKEHATQQQQHRHNSAVAKQAYCEKLEGLLNGSAAEIFSALRSAKQAWRELSMESHGLDARFNTALKNLEMKQAKLAVLERQAQLSNLRAKINLCQQIEAAQRTQVASHANKGISAPQISELLMVWNTEWDALNRFKSGATSAALNKGMLHRYNAAINSFQSVREQALTAQNLARFEESLLRVEMLRNLPGPAELSQQRLMLQVKDLQAAMKNRDQAENYSSNFLVLCTSPLALTGQRAERFQRVLEDSIN